MKSIVIALLLIASVGYGQNRIGIGGANNIIIGDPNQHASLHIVGEKMALAKDHIDFTKEYLWFELSGKIETDGHIYNNTACPFIYEATLSGVKIYRKCEPTVLYKHRKCGEKDCGIIHLETLRDFSTVKYYNTPGIISPHWDQVFNPGDVGISDTTITESIKN